MKDCQILIETQIQQIISKIEDRLQKIALQKPVHLAIADNGWKLEDDWLYVSVQPTVPGERALDYADAMSEIEQELQKEGHDNVILVPVRPED